MVEISIDKPNSTYLAQIKIENASFSPGSSNSFELVIADKDKKEDLRKCFFTVKINVGGQEDPWKFDLTIQAYYTDGSSFTKPMSKIGIALSERSPKTTFSLSELVP
jgi:hypothetical protein